MDNDFNSPAKPQDSGFATPLLISMAGMLATTLAIVTYHFLLVKYCIRRQRQNQATENTRSGSLPIQVPNSDQVLLPDGVEEEILKKLPILSFSAAAGRSEENECVVCLGELEDGDTVRLLPNCKHLFHLSCIDDWFLAHSNCPVCRAPVVPEFSDPTLPNSTDRVSCCLNPTGDRIDGSSGSGTGRIVRNRNDMISDGLLRHCVSFVLPRTPLKTELKRSLSLDQSYIVINVGGGENENVEKGDFLRCWGSYKVESMRSHLERNRLSLLKSFSQIQIGMVSTAN